jgi:glycosyltransferase involved in cell wall biosynthesis
MVEPSSCCRLLMVNQVAGPLARELLEDLCAAGLDCAVVTGWLEGPAHPRLQFGLLPAKPLVKAPAWRRLWSWGVFTFQACRRIAFGRPELVLVATNPPWVMLAMPFLRRLLGVRYALLVYDIFPDLLVRMGLIRPGGVIDRAWRRLSRDAMRAAQVVITLGPCMARTIRGHLRPGDRCRIEIVPNWADTDFIRPIPKADNPFVRAHGLAEKFVVTYSGSFGATHDTESILAAAEALADEPDVHFMLIGGGTRQRDVARLVAEKRLANLTLLPLQPLETLPYSLAASDCIIVCLDESYGGISVPSKTYYAMAAGGALLAVSPPGTELVDLVSQWRCGVWVPPRRADLLAEAVRAFRRDPNRLASCRQAARAAAETHFARRVATGRYERLLRQSAEP